MRRASWFLSLISVFLFSSPPLFSISSDAYAKDASKGTVVEIRDGSLSLYKNNGWTEITKGSAVSLGDRLKTDAKGLAVVEVEQAGRFVIGPATEIELGRDAKNFKANMDRGAVWLNAKFNKGSTGSITTSLATAGVRGTKFSVFYGNGTKDLCICTCSGSVDGTLKNGSTITVPKGMVLVIKGSSPAPTAPESALPYLEKKGWAFCWNCHEPGGKGRLKDGLQ